jgi:hypothetical protein
MAEISGESRNDKKLWFTYLSWPRDILKNYRRHDRAEVDEKNRRFDTKYSDSLQSILFSCMVMEYRIKRTFEYKGINYRKRDTLGTLIDILWTKLQTVNTEKSKQKCMMPKRWSGFHRRLTRWVEVRNALVHGNYAKIQRLIAKRKAITEAKECYNDMVELIKILNGAIEYYEGNKRDFINRMNRLKFR